MFPELPDALKDFASRLSPRAVGALLVLALLSWAGPNLRDSLEGMLEPPWPTRLAVAYLVAVCIAVAAAIVLPFWTYKEQRDVQRQLQEFHDVTVRLGNLSTEANSLVLAAHTAGTQEERDRCVNIALRFLTFAAREMFRDPGGATKAVLLVPEGDDLVPHPQAHSGYQDRELEGIRLPADQRSVGGHVFVTRAPYVANSVLNDPHFWHIPNRITPAAVICAPVSDGAGHCVAVLSVSSRRRDGFMEANGAHLRIIASRMSDVLAAL